MMDRPIRQQNSLTHSTEYICWTDLPTQHWCAVHVQRSDVSERVLTLLCLRCRTGCVQGSSHSKGPRLTQNKHTEALAIDP